MQGATDAAMFVNLVNIILGAGFLSIPWAFAGASLAGGALVSAVATVCWAANKRCEISKFKFKFPRARTFEFWELDTL